MPNTERLQKITEEHHDLRQELDAITTEILDGNRARAERVPVLQDGLKQLTTERQRLLKRE